MLVATTHLESPTGGSQLYSAERVAQARQAFNTLEEWSSKMMMMAGSRAGGACAGPTAQQAPPCPALVVFGGDMNWNDGRDGRPPLPPGWLDAWSHLRPGDPGFTYHPKANPMLRGNSLPGMRLDRFFCKLPPAGAGSSPGDGAAGASGGGVSQPHCQLVSIQLCGTQPVASGKTYVSERSGQALPLLPSDHFGLLLSISISQAPGRRLGAS